jgi:hypothetical protein
MSEISYVYGTENDKYNAYTIYRDGRRLEPEPLAEYIEKLESRIAELEAKLRWISVKVMTPDSSRLPKRYDVVITSRPHVETAYYKNHKWFVYEGGNKVDITNLVTHWKERPLPPEEYQHDPA